MSSRWAVLVLLCFTRGTMGVQSQSVPPVTAYLVAELGLSYAQVGWLIGLFSMPGVALALAGGLLATRLGDKRVMLLGLASLVVGAELFALAGGFPAAFAGRLLSGIGFVLVNPLMMKQVTDHFEGRELATAMGVLMMSWPVGISLALAGLGGVAAAVSWRIALHGAGAVSLVALLLVAALLPARTARETAEGGRAVAWLTRNEVMLLLVLSGLWGLYNSGFTVFLGFAPTLLGTHYAGEAAAATAASVASWVWVASLPLGGLLCDRLGRPGAFIVVGGAASALLLGLLPASPWPLPTMALIGLVFGAAPGAVMALPAQVMRPGVRSVGFGVFYTAQYLIMGGLPPVGGWLLDRTGAPAAPVWFAALLFGLMPVVLLAFRALQRRLPVRAGAG